jgi:ribose 5-phosphate isomerase A
VTQEEKKRAVAQAAVAYVEAGSMIGVGTGSTANHFIDALAHAAPAIAGAVASSIESERRLRGHGIPVVDLAEVERLALYVDGADEATRGGLLLKGGGGALTREKIVAAASRRFVCVVDDSKLVERLGHFPLAIEVIAMARRFVAKQLARLGGRAVLRESFLTDNGHLILDVHDLRIERPAELETALDHIPGVVSNGLFCRRPADVLLVGTSEGVRVLDFGGQ